MAVNTMVQNYDSFLETWVDLVTTEMTRDAVQNLRRTSKSFNFGSSKLGYILSGEETFSELKSGLLAKIDHVALKQKEL